MSQVNQDTFCPSPYVKVIKDEKLNNIDTVSGINGGPLEEIITIYDKASSEKVIDGIGRSFIVFGRDRDAGIASGHQGIGTTGASCIDIIVGHGGVRPVRDIKKPGDEEKQVITTGKNFKDDISRLYLSEKTINIDQYIGIPESTIKMGTRLIKLERNSNVGAAALISDTVRLVGRENIKIVTQHGGINSSAKSTLNSGIAIIAGSNKVGFDKRLSPQPMTKGNSLIKCLTSYRDLIAKLNDIVTSILDRQKVINEFIFSHVHQSNSAGLPTSPMVGESIRNENFKFLLSEYVEIALINKAIAGIESKYFNVNSNDSIISVYNVNN